MCRRTSDLSLLVSMQFFPNYRITLTAHISKSDTALLVHWLRLEGGAELVLCLSEVVAAGGQADAKSPVAGFLVALALAPVELGLFEVGLGFWSDKTSTVGNG
jgi:hypothetical protein